MILPLEAHGVKVISMGFFVPEETPVIWRGPMLHKAIEQFLGDVYWGDLDFLLCDLPPGTGDVSISLASFLPGASMLVVTTPQEAARKVAERAGKMAERTNLRPIGVIENMSYFVCPHCGEREAIFGEGGGQEAADDARRAAAGAGAAGAGAAGGRRRGRARSCVSDPDAPASVALREAARAVGRATKSKVGKPLAVTATLTTLRPGRRARLGRPARGLGLRRSRSGSGAQRGSRSSAPRASSRRGSIASATQRDHHRERGPLRAGERTEPLVDPQRVLEQPRAAVPEPEQ